MNKLIASAGVIALSASAVNASPIESVDPGKHWTVGATLRGFYDDNYTTSSTGERDSFGLEISPAVSYRIEPTDRTSLGLRYTFGAKWFQDRDQLNSNNDSWDYSHAFDGFLEHRFTERVSLSVRDTFVVSQEPGLLNGGTPYRTEGDNIRNTGQVILTTKLSSNLELVLGYNNVYVDYENSGFTNTLTSVSPSLSGLLDRTEHEGKADLRWQARKDSTVVVGYAYGALLHNSDELIEAIVTSTSTNLVTSDYRDNRYHKGYLGLDQNVSKDFVVTVQGGVQHVEYYNDLYDQNKTSPYGQATLNYRYRPYSAASLGWSYAHRPTDVISSDANGSITQDINASTLFVGLSHYFDARWQGKIDGFWQNSTFNGGAYDGQTDDFFGVSLGLTYRFNRHLSGNVEYSFDTLSSDLGGRDYDRNRIFLGVTALY